jgi:GT2 family glycosyltransferase
MTGAPPADSAARIRDGYAAWVAAHDTLSEADHAAIRRCLARPGFRPLLSLLLPLGFAGQGRAAATIADVAAQLYPNWQLCVAGRSDADEGAVACAATGEPRITRLPPQDHADPADAINAALAAADGLFVILLQPGDRLPAHALFEVAAALGAMPDTDLLYTDEDLIDAEGVRSDPRFKTGWDPDLLLAGDCIGRLAVWRTEVVARAGGLRRGFGDAAPYDLALRATATMLPDRIAHLPAVLCHRAREAALPLRTRMLGAEAAAAQRAVAERLGDAARIAPAPLWPEGRRIVWPVPDPAPLVSVIVLTRDRAELLSACAAGVLHRTDYKALELLIVDNESREAATVAALATLAADPRVRVLHRPGPFNFSALNNDAVRAALGEVIVLLNNDVEVIDPSWLREMVGQALRPDVGAVGARLLYADGTVQHGGIVLGPGLAATPVLRGAARGDPGYGGQLALARSLLAVTGACLALRRSVWEEAGGMNAERFAVAFNDVDFCLRLGELGYRILWTPFAELFHLESQTRGIPATAAERAREQREVDNLWYGWRHVFAADPYQNANLACDWLTPLHLAAPRRLRPWRTED